MHPTQGNGLARSQFPSFPQRTHTYHGRPTDSSMTSQGAHRTFATQDKANSTAGHMHVERTYPDSLPSNSPWQSTVSPPYELPVPVRDVSPGQPNDPRYWSYEHSPGSGDFAPFPNEAAQRVRTPSSTFNAPFAPPNAEQLWQLQQPAPAVRTSSYPLTPASMAATLPQYAVCYAPEPQQLPAVSYPPYSVPFESPQAVRPMQGPPFSTPIPQSHSFPEHAGPYHQQGPHEPGPMQGYPVTWYPEPTGVPVSMAQESGTPAQGPSTYVVPSQRPR